MSEMQFVIPAAKSNPAFVDALMHREQDRTITPATARFAAQSFATSHDDVFAQAWRGEWVRCDHLIDAIAVIYRDYPRLPPSATLLLDALATFVIRHDRQQEEMETS